LDRISIIFFLTVILISRSVLVFSLDYIKNDLFFNRFHLILLRFIFSIVLLIFTPNLISILWGWDGLGIRSYLLVIYYNNSKSLNAGIVTALTNRLGDSLLIGSIGVLFLSGSLNYNLIAIGLEESIFIFLIFILGSFTKRAQLPFRAWLPAAIAAPTPVSALVHSSTLVTAGVYILIRQIR